MIVSCKGKQYFVVTLCISLMGKRNSVFCLDVEDSNGEWLDMSDLQIEDGRIPKEVCMSRETTEGTNDSYICLESSEIHEYGDIFYDDLEDDKYEALLIYHTYLNDIRVLHGFPPKDLSFLEKYKTIPPKTAEEKRQEALSAELDEYLRIGEEIEESKKHNQNS